MSHITAERIRALCPQANAEIVLMVAPALDSLAPGYDVGSLLRRSHLMGQLAYESAYFTRLVENMNYSAERIAVVWPRLAPRAAQLAHNPEALADAAYGGRYGNRPEGAGDGWRYRGRGEIQLTFHDNYRDRGQAIGVDLLAAPDMAADSTGASQLALSFWQSHGCNQAADMDDCAAVTLIINGSARLAGEQLADKPDEVAHERAMLLAYAFWEASNAEHALEGAALDGPVEMIKGLALKGGLDERKRLTDKAKGVFI